jgi:hypothetical protein
MPSLPKRTHNPVLRAMIEIAFILFLFYANLLMGEYTRHMPMISLGAALYDVITLHNFGIGLAAAILGYITFEYLRSRS